VASGDAVTVAHVIGFCATWALSPCLVSATMPTSPLTGVHWLNTRAILSAETCVNLRPIFRSWSSFGEISAPYQPTILLLCIRKRDDHDTAIHRDQLAAEDALRCHTCAQEHLARFQRAGAPQCA
jgi:hypothetical protein